MSQNSEQFMKFYHDNIFSQDTWARPWAQRAVQANISSLEIAPPAPFAPASQCVQQHNEHGGSTYF
jgi:hypothetical protein